MLFHEVYGSYYNAVAKILAAACEGRLDSREMYRIIEEKGFAESSLAIPDTLMNSDKPLLDGDFRTPLKEVPTIPLTTLQKRWLKAILADPRIRLFGVDDAGLEDVEPLYEQGSIVYFDQYRDGDPFGDEAYIAHFRTILEALKEHRRLQIRFTGGHGKPHNWDCLPLRLEYSLKDDKFRLHVLSLGRPNIINLARISEIRAGEAFDPAKVKEPAQEKPFVKMLLRDERNALERAMLHFSHLEKETVKLSEDRYEVTLWYDRDDETELLIRVLSFGPMIRVTEPASFIELIRERLDMQKKYLSS